MLHLNQFFKPAKSVKEIPRLVVSADGLDKRGKTYWAIMTSPGPHAVVTADTGTNSIIQRAIEIGRPLSLLELEFEAPNMAVISHKDIDSKQHELWKTEWAKYRNAMEALIEEPPSSNRTRTLVVDTGTAIKNLCELAYFGKARGNNNQTLRTEMNGAFHKIFWDLYKKRPDLNMIWIHQNKKQYAENSKGDAVWNGKYERDGWGKIGFGVDLTLNFEWDSNFKDFYTEIPADQPLRFMDQRDRLIGKRWYAGNDNDPSAFWNLAMTIFPETEMTPEVWGV